jgi:hypothetical protein
MNLLSHTVTCSLRANSSLYMGSYRANVVMTSLLCSAMRARCFLRA